jgi:acyl-CoA synthetase (AMP-forming)/AMP-acid ligase II
MNVATLIGLVIQAMGDDVVVQCGDEALSGGQVYERAGRAATTILESGATAVAYADVNDVLLPVALLASLWSGVPFMPLNYRLSPEQLTGIVARYPGALVLARGPAAATIEAAGSTVSDPASVCMSAEGDVAPPWKEDPDAVAVLLHTSGTTAAPKAAVLRHRHLTSYVLSATELLAATGETALISVPPYHIAGMANLLTNMYAGRKLVYLSAFSAPAWIDAAEAEGATRAMVVPTMLARILEELEARGALGPATLRSLSYGGARTPRPLLERALARFPGTGFVNAYGLTETASTIAVLGPTDHERARDGDPAALRRLDSVGRVLPDIEVEIVSEGRVVGPNEVGEIRVRGGQVSGEYLEGSPGVDAEGWFFTRDLGWIDDDGYLFVQGRGDDTIIRGGENVAPEEIESVLHRHPMVADVAVVGLPDEAWGEIIAAIVVPAGDLSTEDVRSFAQSELRSSKTPDRVFFRDELPYSPTGKLLRAHLRRELGADAGAPS